MTLLVVSPRPELADALGRSTPVVGLTPDDVPGWIADPSEQTISGIILDTGPNPLPLLGLLREAGYDVPVLLVVPADSPAVSEALYDHADVGTITRPFTASGIRSAIDALTRPAPPATTFDASVSATPKHAPKTRSSEPETPPMQTPANQTYYDISGAPASGAPVAQPHASLSDLDSAISALLEADLYSVAEVAAAVIDDMGLAELNAVVLLVEDGVYWRVAATTSRRAHDRRAAIADDHWLARRLSGGRRAVIVEGTDIARSQLREIPLGYHEQWMATSVPDAHCMVLVANDSSIPFTVDQARHVGDVVADAAPLLLRSIALRDLARHLQRFVGE
jgi:hypothetical protein